ncbi:MAG TPA: hypothetical protein VFH85_02155 [Gammaproteobacteria bacterium]|nr:hypothetical protein [Gammaproteobacteria bacterium]
MSEQASDFLDEYTAEDQATEPEATEQPPESGTVETPDAEAADTAEVTEPEATTAPEAPKDDHVPLAALKAEREKRQNFERRAQELEQQIAEQQTPKSDIWEDPDGFVNQRLQAVEQQFNGRLYAALEDAAREAHPDFDEVFAVVESAAENNPAISQKVFSSPNPAMAAYKLGKQLVELKQMDDPESYRAKIEAEVRAKIKAEQEAEAQRSDALSKTIPPDLATSRSVKGNDTPASEDVFDSIFQG